MGLGGYAPAPESVGRDARAAGAITPGTFRVIAYDGGSSHHDFATLEEARKHADDVASEADYEGIPPAAYVVDSKFECIDIGIHYAVRKPGKSAWESYLLRRGPGAG
jgi:hypothetical protein